MLDKILLKLNRAGMLLYILIFLLNSFFPLDSLKYFLGGLTLFIIISGLGFMSSFNKYVSVVLIGLGTLFLSIYPNTFVDFCNALIHNVGIVALLLAIPLLEIVFHYDDYEKYVMNLAAKYMNTELKFYSLTSFFTSFFGVFINLGSIPFVYQLFLKHSENFSENLMYKAINRGFFSNMLWAPSCIAVAVIIEYFNLSWQQIAPVGLTLAVLAHILAAGIEKIVSLKNKKRVFISVVESSINTGEVFKLFILVFILIFSVIVLDLLTGKSFLVIMCLISLFVPFILSIVYKKFNTFTDGIKEYYVSLDDKHNEFILFSAIGYFAYALQNTNIGEYIAFLLNAWGFNSPLTVIPLFIFLVLVLSIIGVHPIITISTIASTVSIEQLPISLEQLAFSLLIGYSLYQLVSPFSTAVLVLTSLTHKNPLDVSIKINKIYVVLFVALSALILANVY
ncbi:MAG: hypothetical protein GXW85_08045 [Clostridia bacterium]|nr:hypothetical protein [Clostridia bacterium]